LIEYCKEVLGDVKNHPCDHEGSCDTCLNSNDCYPRDDQDGTIEIQDFKQIIDDAADQLGCTPGEEIVRAIVELKDDLEHADEKIKELEKKISTNQDDDGDVILPPR
jgi:hypothetical protein